MRGERGYLESSGTRVPSSWRRAYIPSIFSKTSRAIMKIGRSRGDRMGAHNTEVGTALHPARQRIQEGLRGLQVVAQSPRQTRSDAGAKVPQRKSGIMKCQ